jgi:hypothetical protein
MGGIEYHPHNRWKSYRYAGRFAYLSPTRTAADYGSHLVSYAECWSSEVAMDSKTEGTFRPESNSLILLAALFASILAFTCVLAAQSRGTQYSQEQVEVVGHLDLQGMPVKQILQQRRGEKGYLFLRRADKNAFAIVDVTNAAKPVLLDRNALPEPTGGNISLSPSGSALAIAFVPDRRSGSTRISPQLSSVVLGKSVVQRSRSC